MIETAPQRVPYSPQDIQDDALREYAHNLRGLLGTTVCYRPLICKENAAAIAQETAYCDLVVLGDLEHSWLEMMLSSRPTKRTIARLSSSTSVLLARRPRWPIKEILLILRVEETDKPAVDWLVRLLQPGETAVTILPIVPSVPAMYTLGNRIQTGLDVLLSPNTPSGCYLRLIAKQLAQKEVEARLHLRQGDPAHQIQEEIAEGNYDLVLLGAEPHGRFYRLLLGELVAPLLRWINRPLLIARPLQSARPQ